MKNTHIYRVFSDMHFGQFIIACCIMALLLETVLMNTVRSIRHFDEVIAILMGVAFLVIVIIERRLEKDEAAIILLTICMIIIGFAGNFKYDLVHSKYLWCLDAFNIFKFIAASLGAVRLFSRIKHNEYVIRYLALFTEIVIFYASIFLIIHTFTDINMSTDVRYGFRTYHFIFWRVGDYYEACLYFLMIFFADLYVEKRRITWGFIALTMLNMVSTMRSRAVAYAAIFVLFYIAFVVFKVEKIKLRYTLPIGVLAAITFAGQFVYYFTGDKARNVLLRYGVRTMRAYFPIGSGFATYGTSVAKDHYSKLFFRYGFWRYYGTSMSRPNFLLDNYWPAIMAELGFFGALFMLIVILLMFRRNVRKCNNPYSRIGIYSCWIALFIASTVSGSFLAGTKAMVMSALIGVLVPIASEASRGVEESRFSVDKIKLPAKLTAMKKLIIAMSFVLLCVMIVGFKFRHEIKQRLFPAPVEKTASIVTDTEAMIYDGSEEFSPFTDDLTVLNARLSDLSFRDKSVNIIRKVTGDRYSTLTDEEIEAVTGEQVINGRTKEEILRDTPEGEEIDLSVFDNRMTADERAEILSTSEALNQTFDLSGEALREVLSVIVSNAKTGNFRDRFINYYYKIAPGNQKQIKIKLRLEGYHLPAMMLPETFPVVTREDLKIKVQTRQEQARRYEALANYLGITSNNGYGGDGNNKLQLTVKYDKLQSQLVTLKFIHDTLYGIGVNRKFTLRLDGPEITLSDYAVKILKGSDFDPSDYVVSVLNEDGTSARNLLEITNYVKVDTPGFYTVQYSCGDNSKISLRVKVCLTEDELIEE